MKWPPSRTGTHLVSGYHALALALVAMVVLVAGATWQALRAEASNNATAERTLQDYSAFAAWNFGQQAGLMLHGIGGPTMTSIDPGNGNPAPAVLQHPAVLLGPDTATCDSTRATYARFAFRIDLPEGRIVTAGKRPSDAELAELVERLPPLMRTGGPERHRFAVPVVGGRPMRLATTLIVTNDSSRRPRAIYGMAFDSAQLARELTRILRNEHLLPPVLLKRAPTRHGVHIAVRTPQGALLYASDSTRPSAVAARDTMVVEQGHLVVEASIDPALAPALVIGGLPSSRLPALLGVLGVAILLAGVGFMQIRRERELMRLRSRFVANVSHELRTPLAQISMFGETLMLGRERTDEERHHFATVIHREARRLATLVESVLRFSRGEAGRTELRLDPCNLAEELREATDDFTPLARAANATLRLDVDPSLVADVDRSALRQVVMNLLENATKYGPRGQTITVGAVASDEEALVTVDDEGPGIPPADRRRVLAAFTRLERPGQPKVAGTGIGLAVVDDLVRAHGGKLWIDDAPGGGARVCFTVRLSPQGAVHPVEQRPQPAVR